MKQELADYLNKEADKTKAAQRAKARHKHEFVTIQSLGAMGHVGKCVCGKTTTFLARE